jgi:hypothetical protein
LLTQRASLMRFADKPMTMDEWDAKWCSAGENVSN